MTFYKRNSEVMPQFILKINSPADTVYDDEKIVCYAADAALPDSLLAKLNSGSRMLLLAGPDAAKRCKELNADGILAPLDPSKPVKAQLEKQQAAAGKTAVVVPVIPPRRHEAMLASETEPPFVAFAVTPANREAVFPVLKWYNDLFLIQSAVDLTAGAVELSGLDADFVIINSADYADFSC